MEPVPFLPGETMPQWNARVNAMKAERYRAESEQLRKAANLRRRMTEGHGNYVFAERPRCPRCNSVELKPYRTTKDGETISRHELCKSCEFKFVLVLE